MRTTHDDPAQKSIYDFLNLKIAEQNIERCLYKISPEAKCRNYLKIRNARYVGSDLNVGAVLL